MELNTSSAETVFTDKFTWCHRHVNKQNLNARVKIEGLFAVFEQTTMALYTPQDTM